MKEWSINDAKEGDVLVTKWREDALGEIFIFKGIKESHGTGYIKWHCLYDLFHREFRVCNDETHLGPVDCTIVRPATEEEEILIAEVMDDYKCYFDNEELKIVYEEEREVGKPEITEDDYNNHVMRITYLNGLQRGIIERLVESWNNDTRDTVWYEV